VNQYETNGMIEQFTQKGYEKVGFETKADIYVINTCTVTNMSDKKSRQIIRKAKKLNPEGIVVVTGCYAEVSKEEVEEILEVEIVILNDKKKDIVEIIEGYVNDVETNSIDDLTPNSNEFLDFEITAHTERARISIKVQDGCDNFCSYCIIPYAKGRVRSRKPESVVNEIREAVRKGIKEVVITGIHIASYGKDLSNIGIIDLLEEVNKVEGLKRIRLGSLEPTLITEEFVRRLKRLDKICDHFHLSLQSGNDKTLKRMNRKYSTKQFEESVRLLREKFPEAGLTTDVIVGFPGETEEDFEKTYGFLEKINFSKMHIFKFSPRKGTPAAKMAEQVNEKIKEERSKRLIELSGKNEKTFLEMHVGKEIQVLFEQREGEQIKGHTTNYIVVGIFDSNQANDINLENQISTVKIIKRNNFELIGEVM